jgi:16S rRNA (guanine527-N7)-methyltransferase
VKHAPEEAEKILAQSSAWGFDPPLDRASVLVEFASTLNDYEEANVIGAKTLPEVIDEHILDSLSCLIFEPTRNASMLVDVGSGGGLPGLPVGIVLEKLQVSLVEATAKKAKFLEHAIRRLGVSNFRVLNQRAEELGSSGELRGKFDVATARALASLDVLAEYCMPLVKVGGHVVAMKGSLEEKELDRGEYAAKILGGRVSAVIEVQRLPVYEQKQRHLVIFTKTSETPGKYPRRVGLPAKKPLGKIGNA